MRNSCRVVLSLPLFVALAGCQAKQAQIVDQDVAAIRTQTDTYARTALAADWDRWGNTMTSDAVFFPPDHAPLEGRDAIVAWARALPKLSSFTAPLGEVNGLGDLAYATGTYSLAMTAPAGSPVTEQGSFVNVFRRQSDGSWRFSRSIWHPNSPPSPAPQPAK